MKHPEYARSLLSERLFPGDCALCGTLLLDMKECWYGLCQACMSRVRLDLALEPRCSVCGRPLVSEQGVCMSCREKNVRHTFDRTLALFPYSGLYRDLLVAFKFGKRRALGNFFAERLLEGLAYLPYGGDGMALTPVPPRPGKLKAGGWDQIACLAGILERMRRVEPLCPPVCRCLKRLPSRSQKELGGEARKTNLQGKFSSISKAPRRVIVFDDVITTGSTLDACADALKADGADVVYGLCLFYD
ncbi:MAG: double zinc ribbon domain-containing protein [Treponema sp.]|jgi:ComF family protein|nr:double zinc ribbon domain-containing protein [Treponema sp.]